MSLQIIGQLNEQSLLVQDVVLFLKRHEIMPQQTIMVKCDARADVRARTLQLEMPFEDMVDDMICLWIFFFFYYFAYDKYHM